MKVSVQFDLCITNFWSVFYVFCASFLQNEN